MKLPVTKNNPCGQSKLIVKVEPLWLNMKRSSIIQIRQSRLRPQQVSAVILLTTFESSFKLVSPAQNWLVLTWTVVTESRHTIAKNMKTKNSIALNQ